MVEPDVKVNQKPSKSRPQVSPESAHSWPKVDPLRVSQRLAQDHPKVGQSRPRSDKIGPGPILADQNSGPIQKHQIGGEMGRESMVWPETCSRSMPGLFRSLWDRSNPLQAAVPGLVLEVQVGCTTSVWPEASKKGSKYVENRRLGPKQRPNESYSLSRPIQTTPEAKNSKQKWVFRENGPWRPAAGTVRPRFIGAPRCGAPMHDDLLF